MLENSQSDHSLGKNTFGSDTNPAEKNISESLDQQLADLNTQILILEKEINQIFATTLELITVLKEFYNSPKVKNISYDILAEIMAKTNFFANLQNLGFRLRQQADDSWLDRQTFRKNKILKIIFGKRDVLMGNSLRYNNKLQAGTAKHSRKGIKLSGEPDEVQDLTVDIARFGELSNSAVLAFHEGTHRIQHQLEQAINHVSTQTLPNTILNEAFARRTADYSFGTPNYDRTAKIIETELLILGLAGHYRYATTSETREAKIQEWTDSFQLIDELYALGNNPSQIAEVLVKANQLVRNKYQADTQNGQKPDYINSQIYLKNFLSQMISSLLETQNLSQADLPKLIAIHHSQAKIDRLTAIKIARSAIKKWAAPSSPVS